MEIVVTLSAYVFPSRWARPKGKLLPRSEIVFSFSDWKLHDQFFSGFPLRLSTCAEVVENPSSKGVFSANTATTFVGETFGA